MFRRIAIVNRGEAAMRLIHAVRDLQADGADLTTIALYTDAERAANFVREADEAYPIGPASARPYLDHALLERVLVESQADAVWVGWGFVAEDPAFVELCDRLGIAFIGPSAEAMRRLGDKIGSKLIAEEVGVPVAPWSRGPVSSLDEALEAAERIGYPLMLKATAGGGGRGIRRVDTAADLSDAYQRTRDEAERAFGSGVVFLERLVTGARHVEVQLIADSQGTAWALGVRDCSVQRRNQKVIEESSSPLLSPEQVAELKASAERLAIAVGYVGAGTVEFLYHPGEQTLAFLEVNTRLQVEHPITEVTTGVDLVKLQIHVASGGRLEGERPAEEGHAIEARLNAEDPDRDFAPAPGRITRLDLPAGPGIRVDTGVSEGTTIPADFDSMIAKIIAWGRDRREALARLRRAMGDTTVVIDGGASNKSFVLDLLDQPEILRGDPAWADTGWIDRVRSEGRLATAKGAGAALVTAGIRIYFDELGLSVRRLLDTARGGRPQVQHEAGRSVELKLRGTTYRVATRQVGPEHFRVTVRAGDEAPVDVDARWEPLDDTVARLEINGVRHRVVAATHGPSQFIEVNGVAHRVSVDEGGVLRAPAPALVVATPVAVGAEVQAGAPILVLESMKMETVLHAPFRARVKELVVITGSQVETGAPLVKLEPLDTGEEQPVNQPQGSLADLGLPPAAEPAPHDAAERELAELASALLGYDDDGSALTDHLAARGGLADPMAAEMDLLSLVADLAELSRNQPVDEDRATELRVHSAREHMHTYLQSLDVERGDLPDTFREKLTRVLAHYGVHSLDRTPELEEAVFRIFVAQQRAAAEAHVAAGILQGWVGQGVPAGRGREVRALLERLVRATQLRAPVVSDLARSIRFRWFDQPLVDRYRAVVLSGVAAEVDELADPQAPDRAARIDALVNIPEQVVSFLAARLAIGLPEREPLLEVLIRRHYREYELHDLREEVVGGRPFCSADYVIDDRPTHLVSTIGTVAELAGGPLVDALGEELARRADHQQMVAELYLHGPEVPTDEDEGSAYLAELVAALPFMHQVRRVVVAVSAGEDQEMAYYTFRPAEGGGVYEDELVRGVHPMVGRRLALWRLSGFEVTRLPAPRDVLLYECVARTNPDDRRLVALAQVRQSATVTDDSGNVIGLPHVERAVEICLEAIRRTRTARGAIGARLDVNHVWVQVWPVVEADPGQLSALQGKITPLTEGAGLEEVLIQGRLRMPEGEPMPVAFRFHNKMGTGVVTEIGEPPTEPLKPLDEYSSKVLRMRRRGLVYPYELGATLSGPHGSVTELDLDESGALAPVSRAYGLNTAGIIVALVTTPTKLHPEGITRVVLAGDPTKSLGSVSEQECRRIIAALDLAEQRSIPVEWFALSSGARIAMNSGTENMDWVASALKRIVEFTQDGGEINVVVAGINVGAQPYWNAEATMLMHTKGILVMTPDSAMVLTGKQSLDFSGGVSAEDNFGIGGYDRVMGPNGQAQYWAPDLGSAFRVLLQHYECTYVVPGEAGPRRAPSTDPADRDVTLMPHPAGGDFTTVGDIFSAEKNPERKKAFDIRAVMRALADQDMPTLERWASMGDAETAVVFDARVGGHSICLVGIESKPVPRRGFPPTDGPDTYTAGTLFPRSSKKVARAINAASGNRPLVVLANLSGFDGSPESMRQLQLEYGAEIGRAIVNFRGPIVFCVISRYHGGAFVVFSKALNPSMTVLAIEGSYASVIGGAPAAAVVFAGEVEKRVAGDKRLQDLQERIAQASGPEQAALMVEQADLRAGLRAEKISEVAAEFDAVHNIHRAVEVGSVDAVIRADRLRPEIIAALERGKQLGE